MVSEGEVGKEEEERREEEGVRVGQDEEGRETESDDGTPRPNGGTSQVNKKLIFWKGKVDDQYIMNHFPQQDATVGSLSLLSGSTRRSGPLPTEQRSSAATR